MMLVLYAKYIQSEYSVNTRDCLLINGIDLGEYKY